MTGDEMRDQLAEQAWGVLVAAGLRDETRGPSPSFIAHAIVGNLLPVVRKIAADELNDLADSIPCSDSEIEAKQMARARAAALDPS